LKEKVILSSDEQPKAMVQDDQTQQPNLKKNSLQRTIKLVNGKMMLGDRFQVYTVIPLYCSFNVHLAACFFQRC
jgi:hypothetical protein